MADTDKEEPEGSDRRIVEWLVEHGFVASRRLELVLNSARRQERRDVYEYGER